MTRKTYKPLAKDLGDLFQNHHYSGRKTRVSTMIIEVVDTLCHHLKQNNPRFNSAKFRDAINERRLSK